MPIQIETSGEIQYVRPACIGMSTISEVHPQKYLLNSRFLAISVSRLIDVSFFSSVVFAVFRILVFTFCLLVAICFLDFLLSRYLDVLGISGIPGISGISGRSGISGTS